MLKLPLHPDLITPLWAGINHPEDLVWDADRQLLYAGGEGGELYRGTMAGEWSAVAQCGEGAFLLGMALDAAGFIYVCDIGNSRVTRVDPVDFSLNEISDGSADRPMVSPNYPAFDKSGRLFVSDSGSWGRNDGVIYVIDTQGATTIWDTAVSDFPNGIAFSPDNDFLFIVESRTSSVWRTRINLDGSAGETLLAWNEPGTVPDGIAFDAEGYLYVACYTPSTIYRVTADLAVSEVFAHDWTAQFLQAPTNVAFIGESLQFLGSANLNGHHLNVLPTSVAGWNIQRPDVLRR